MKLLKRMLCAECGEVKEVTAIENHQVTLDCSHVRQYRMPLKPNRVSVEHMYKKIGREHFPINWAEGATGKLPGLDFKWR